MSVKKYDVGIYGLWYGRNYGSMITYYALDCVVKSFGYSTAMIKNPLGRTDLDLTTLTPSHPLIFADKHYNITPFYNLNQMSALNDICDKFLLGSDQMWFYNLSHPYRQTYFFDFVNDDRIKVAYATSFGREQYTGPAEEKIITKKNLQRFNAISLRDDFSQEILLHDFGIDANIMIDPVFLCNVGEYEKLINNLHIEIDSPFIFAYILDPNAEIGRALQTIAEKTDRKIVVIFDELNNFAEQPERITEILKIKPDNFIFLTKATVEEWLWCFKNAEFVFTDSFHGTCFSIIFEKNFIVKKNNNRGGRRFEFLLDTLKLKDQMAESDQDILTKFDQVYYKGKVEYKFAKKALDKLTKEGINWLRSSLQGKQKLKIIDKHVDPIESIVPDNDINNGHKDVKEQHEVAAKDNKKLTGSIDKNLDIKNQCTGCGACYNICPTHAITLEENINGFLNPVVNKTKCTQCGLCTAKCVALHPVYKNSVEPGCHAVLANDQIREVSSSGGAFSVIAEYILKNKGLVCGAAFDENYNVKHIIIDQQSDLEKLRGSKYYQSNINDVFRSIKDNLNKGVLVLFTGTPCQVAGLYSYLGKEYQNLYTIDLLCHGISSHKVFEKYRQDVLGNKKLVDLKFKAKKPWGWHAGVNARFNDGSSYAKPLETDPFFISYLQSISKNKPCGTCLFNRLPRQGDLTIGDFWKIQDYDKSLNDNKGTSLVLLNNHHGKVLFDKVSKSFAVSKEVPLSYAIAGNGIIKHPYTLNANRDVFFKYLDIVPFSLLVNTCRRPSANNFVYSLQNDIREYFYLAEIVKRNIAGRKLVLWGDNSKLRAFLEKYYGMKTEFIVTINAQLVDGKKHLHLDYLKGKAAEYYLVVAGKAYLQADYNKLMEFGFLENKDFVYRFIKPIVLENYDLSNGYIDIYGNEIEKSSGIIKKIIFRGYNNKVRINAQAKNIQNLSIDATLNTITEIGAWTNFGRPNTVIEYKGYNGCARIKIADSCYFLDTIIRLYVHEKESLVVINRNSTFGMQLELHANQGKKIIIGKDCMFSHYDGIWAGDGHAMFDVKKGTLINQYDSDPNKNMVVLGEHTWVGFRSIILTGTSIGDGSIVGAQSVVKGRFANNCSIAGSPAKTVRSDVAWSRSMTDTEISKCSGYARLTTNTNVSICGQNVLVIGGTRAMGTQLVKRLLELGNTVTIANRGRTPDSFGYSVNRIILDATNIESVKKALQGKQYDVVFDDVAYSAKNVKNILSNVVCKKYVQLSSIAVYNTRKSELKESDFNNIGVDIDENLIVPNQYSENYSKGKRQAEAMAVKLNANATFVRLPYVVKTDRLKYYVDCIASGRAMKIGNIDTNMSFVSDSDVGEFLPWIAAQPYTGAINFASLGSVTLRTIISYIEQKLGKKAAIDNINGSISPFNERPFSLDIERVIKLGYLVKNLNSWFWSVMDEYISAAKK